MTDSVDARLYEQGHKQEEDEDGDGDEGGMVRLKEGRCGRLCEGDEGGRRSELGTWTHHDLSQGV